MTGCFIMKKKHRYISADLLFFLGGDRGLFNVFKKVEALFKNPDFYRMYFPLTFNQTDLAQSLTVVRCELEDGPYAGSCVIEGKDFTLSLSLHKVCLQSRVP